MEAGRVMFSLSPCGSVEHSVEQRGSGPAAPRLLQLVVGRPATQVLGSGAYGYYAWRSQRANCDGRMRRGLLIGRRRKAEVRPEGPATSGKSTAWVAASSAQSISANGTIRGTIVLTPPPEAVQPWVSSRRSGGLRRLDSSSE